MIIGTGIDLVDIKKMNNTLNRWGERFLYRVYTRREIDYCRGKKQKEASFAARFAAKEAVKKALGEPGEVRFSWKDVEILNEETGKPYVYLHGGARRVAHGICLKEILITLTHDGNYAIAQAIAVGGE